MHVGILGGTGPLGRGLAARLAAAGIDVTVGSRHAERATDVAAELVKAWPGHHLRVSGSDNPGAAQGDLVIAATPWDSVCATAGPLDDMLADKVVISVANALVKEGREMHSLVPARGSIAAALQAALPRSLVAAAGHHLPAAALADLDTPLGADVLVCSDHPSATEATIELLGKVNGLRALDAGSLASASAVEAFTAVLITLNKRYRVHSTLRLGGLDHVGSVAGHGHHQHRS
jgi:NADPH-dependent F420 reductase